jgi:hypothetical protein
MDTADGRTNDRMVVRDSIGLHRALFGDSGLKWDHIHKPGMESRVYAPLH